MLRILGNLGNTERNGLVLRHYFPYSSSENIGDQIDDHDRIPGKSSPISIPRFRGWESEKLCNTNFGISFNDLEISLNHISLAL